MVTDFYCRKFISLFHFDFDMKSGGAAAEAVECLIFDLEFADFVISYVFSCFRIQAMAPPASPVPQTDLVRRRFWPLV